LPLRLLVKQLGVYRQSVVWLEGDLGVVDTQGAVGQGLANPPKGRVQRRPGPLVAKMTPELVLEELPTQSSARKAAQVTGKPLAAAPQLKVLWSAMDFR
jgi:hypothetical protein